MHIYIVRIEKADHLTGCDRQTFVHCVINATIRLSNHLGQLVAVAIDNLLRAVRGSSIHNDMFDIRVGLLATERIVSSIVVTPLNTAVITDILVMENEHPARANHTAAEHYRQRNACKRMYNCGQAAAVIFILHLHHSTIDILVP